MKAAIDGVGDLWGIGDTEEEARSQTVDLIADLPKDQLREFIQMLVEDFSVREVSKALADMAKLEGGSVQMIQARVDGKWMLVTLEEAEAGR